MWRPSSRRLRWVLAIAVPFPLYISLNVLAWTMSAYGVYNVLALAAPVVSLIAGFAFIARERWRVLIALVYFPVMFALMFYPALLLATKFGLSL